MLQNASIILRTRNYHALHAIAVSTLADEKKWSVNEKNAEGSYCFIISFESTQLRSFIDSKKGR